MPFTNPPIFIVVLNTIYSAYAMLLYTIYTFKRHVNNNLIINNKILYKQKTPLKHVYAQSYLDQL